MKDIDEYTDKEIIDKLAREIAGRATHPVKLMVVGGGLTLAIQKFGIVRLLPKTVELVSGLGCPVSVTSRAYIDKLISYCRRDDVIITTYGDLIRVPGSTSTLEKERARGADIQVVYSIMDALLVAKHNRRKKIIFPALGFEATAPSTAAGIVQAKIAGVFNFHVFNGHKVSLPAMEALIDGGVTINGIIASGLVSTVTGQGIYECFHKKSGMGVVISGYEAIDLMQSILMLVNQIENNDPKVEIEYSRAVKPEGNIKAREMMEEVFEPFDDEWRGLGVLKNSGLKIKKEYERHDAAVIIPEVEVEPLIEPEGCIGGEIIKGLKTPKECPLFGKACTPLNPVGPCMVSGDGACRAYYLYDR